VYTWQFLTYIRFMYVYTLRKPRNRGPDVMARLSSSGTSQNVVTRLPMARNMPLRIREADIVTCERCAQPAAGRSRLCAAHRKERDGELARARMRHLRARQPVQLTHGELMNIKEWAATAAGLLREAASSKACGDTQMAAQLREAELLVLRVLSVEAVRSSHRGHG
jgi:hypothetical protein